MCLFHKLIQFLFNTKPIKTAQFFLDNKGRKIWYFWDGYPTNNFYLHHRGKWIGGMQIIHDGNVLELCNIVIYKCYPQYRKSGIGKRSFSLLIDFAEEFGFLKIKGRIEPESIELLPDLLRFYRSLGCEIIGNWFIYWVGNTSL